MKKLLSYLIVFAIGLAFGGLLSVEHFRDATKMIQSDTLYLWDTVRIEKPAEVKYTQLPEPILIPFTDTVEVHDTIYMVANKEVREYGDSMYYARISGYKPNLDYIEVYPRTEIITKTYAPPKNLLSAGVETGYLGSYSLSIYLEYERMLQKNFSIYVQTGYDLPVKAWGMMTGGKYYISW